MIGINYRVPNFNKGPLFMALNDVSFTGYVPGAIGRVAELHGTYYYKHWGFDLFFESKVAMELSEFLRRFNEARDGFWVARVEEKIVGSVAIDGIHRDGQGAHLRWFITAPENQGQGIGNKLLNEAVEFCRKKGHSRIYLWTFAGLHPARHLYEKFGFKLCEEREGEQWGKAVTEQKFELNL
jgi:GNAT superfamily N-acetyltransferase